MFSGELKAGEAPVIGEVVAGGPAAAAGIQAGDVVVSVNGQPVTSFFDVVKKVRTSVVVVDGKPVPLPLGITVRRQGKTLDLTAVPVVDKAPTPILGENFGQTDEKAVQAKLQIKPEFVRVPVPFGPALAEAAVKPFQLVAGLADSVRKPSQLAENVGGPATIAQEVGQAAKLGIDYLITMTALLSISLGVMNLLPIGPLDGGQMVVALAEMFRGGRRLSYQFQMRLTALGAVLVIALILGVVTIDIGRTAIR
jgi:regulator of sigma E protease